MANLLIIDLLEESCYLMRSLLRGKGHSASIAISAEEARTKLDTGLFDALFVDLCEPNEENTGFVEYANEHAPNMPVIALTREEGEQALASLKLAASVSRPIRGARITNAVESALSKISSQSDEEKQTRLSVDYAVKLKIDGETLEARVTDLTAKGFAIDAGGSDFTEARINRLRELAGEGSVEATINPTKKETLKAVGRIAFVDRLKRFNGKMVGLVFEESDEATTAHLANLFQLPVAETSEGEASEGGQLAEIKQISDAKKGDLFSEAA